MRTISDKGWGQIYQKLKKEEKITLYLEDVKEFVEGTAPHLLLHASAPTNAKAEVQIPKPFALDVHAC